MRARAWQGLAVEKLRQWQEVFSASRESWRVRGGCPICLHEDCLYRHYQVGVVVEGASGRTRRLARGGLWEWCSGCWTFVHYAAMVPSWWGGGLEVDEARLTAVPDALQDVVDALSGGMESVEPKERDGSLERG